MELFAHLHTGLATAVSLENLLYCFVGAMLGTFVGILPGLGPAAAIAMLLPVTISLSPTASLIMLAGIYYGSQYGGSTTAILLRLPGETSSAVTSIDGYEMGLKGRAGPALAIAAISSFVAGTFATMLVAVFALPLTSIALSFGAPDYFSLIVLGLVGSVALAHGSVLKALGMITMGLLFGIVGTDIYTGQMRFTFGLLPLADGINVVVVAIGLFGLAEILRNLEHGAERQRDAITVNGLMPSRDEMRSAVKPAMRGTLLGSVLGLLPGGGAVMASFAAYALERRIAADPSRFGKGAVEGVAAPEAANNAGAQTSFIPMLTLGIPANPVMALMIGAMIIQGIIPGPDVVTKQPDLFWGVVVSMWIGNVMLLILNLPLIGLWVSMLKIPYRALFLGIVAFSSIGVFSVSGSQFDLFVLAFFGLIGFLLHKLDCEPSPMLLGFVLGPMLEEHFRRSLLVSRGDPLIFVSKPLSATLLAIAAVVLLLVILPAVRRKREETFVEED